MTWIVVADLTKAIEFYTKTLGFSLKGRYDEFGWAELAPADEHSAHLGLAQQGPMEPMKAGSNAVVCINVDDIEAARTDLAKKGVRLLGEIMTIPDHVRLQTLQDSDGNTFQLAQIIKK
jgi:predicted enzyme related to lactoylglutathione lyase